MPRLRMSDVLARMILLGVSLIGFSGCAGLRFIPEDEELYTGADVRIESEERVPRRRRLQSELEDGIRPQPNTTWLGLIRPGLWIHGAFADIETGLRGRLRDRFGEPPVLFDEVSPERTAETLRRRLGNRGYFDAELEYKITRRRKRAGVTYYAELFEPFRIAELRGPPGDSRLEIAIRDVLYESLVEPGDVYSLDTLIEERSRIDRELKNAGFYYFNPDYLEYAARIAPESRTVELDLHVKPGTPARARRPYRLGSVHLHTGHSRALLTGERDAAATELSPRVYYLSDEVPYRTAALRDAIVLQPGELYNRRRHLDTISRLMDLGVFQFVTIRYRQAADNETLDAEVHLTPMMEKSLQAELRAVTKSNNYAGPGLSASYLDRNLRGGAEQLELQLLSSVETRIDTTAWSLDSYELGAEVTFSIPRIVSPLPIGTTPGRRLPRTRIRAGYRALTRVDAYRLDSFNAGFAYLWSADEFSRHELRPVDATIVRPRDFDPEFEELLDISPALRRAFDEQFIIASGYSYRYNTRPDDTRRHHAYFGVDLETAGNLLHATQVVRRGESPQEDDPFQVFGVPYAQYLRLDTDNRAYLGVTENTRFAARVLAGAGQALGNAQSMPSIKQFSVGGTNSIRAFPARSIGPGTVQRPVDDRYVERLGDMRLESNLEYRFPLVGLFRGALFLDAGNVWNLRDDKDVPGSMFEPGSALRELYAGAGAGIRLRTPFVVLRLDLAFPLREADRPPGERWVIDDVNFADSDWRRDNLLFNLAIGYPF